MGLLWGLGFRVATVYKRDQSLREVLASCRGGRT